jgi:hypothetical protein
MLNVEGLRLNEGDSANIRAFTPSRIQAESKTKDKVLVNLLQNNYYGWKAFVDGQPTEIFTGNMSFISVKVPSGEHEVVFKYDPVGVKIGFWISLMVFVAGVGWLVIAPTSKGVGSNLSNFIGTDGFTRRTRDNCLLDLFGILNKVSTTAKRFFNSLTCLYPVALSFSIDEPFIHKSGVNILITLRSVLTQPKQTR